MNLAIKITISRLWLFCIALIFVLYNNFLIGFFFGAIAAISDIVDGYVARRSKCVTRLGGALDFLVDKLTNTSAVFLFTINNNFEIRIPIWVSCIIVTQAVFQIIAWVLLNFFAKKNNNIKTPRTKFGRFVFIAQNIGLGIILLQELPILPKMLIIYLFYIIGVLTVILLFKDCFLKDYSEYIIE